MNEIKETTDLHRDAVIPRLCDRSWETDLHGYNPLMYSLINLRKLSKNERRLLKYGLLPKRLYIQIQKDLHNYDILRNDIY